MAAPYDLDFLFIALTISLMAFFHYRSQPRMVGSANDHIFSIIFPMGILDILLDILTTILIASKNGGLRWLTILLLTVFYLLQLAVPSAFLCYTISLRRDKPFYRSRILRFMAVPAALMGAALVVNPLAAIVFTIDARGIYVKGPLYYAVYGYAGACVVAAAVWSLARFRELGRKHFVVVWEFILICAICVSIQLYDYTTLTTGLGICLGLLALYMSINAPSVHVDTLTGAWDKQRMDQWLEQGMKQRFHLVAVELYRLKTVNSLYGDRTGDHILVEIARWLRRTPRSHLFRLGSGRFYLFTYDQQEYEKLCRKLQEAFQTGFLAEDGRVVSCPAILCAIPDAQTLKNPSDLVAYQKYLAAQVKASGKTRLIQDSENARQGFRYEQEVERFLHTAVEEDLFELYYQPVWSTERGRYVSLEALSRLRHPELGMIPPDVFIAIAERSGQIARVSQLQFGRLCRFVKENREALSALNNVKYNLSPVELQQEGQGQRLVEILGRSGVDGAFIQMEITETTASEGGEAQEEAVRCFREAGIRLCLDDFGVGYANLNTVLKMPFHVIKLDRELLRGICDDPQIAAFYRSIVEVLHHLGYLLVAEGVERKEELDLIASWGVNLVQGFYFSRPLPPGEVLEKVKAL